MYEITAMHKSGKIMKQATVCCGTKLSRSMLGSINKVAEKIVSDYEDGKYSKSKRKRKHNIKRCR